MKKKCLSLLLCVSMALGLSPTIAFAAEHTDHCVCGASHKSIGDHTTKEKITWTPWGDNEGETSSLPSSTGNYYLTNDITFPPSDTSTVGTAQNINLCLNGHTITRQTGDSMQSSILSISVNASLTLTDCKGNGAISGKGSNLCGISNYGTFRMYGGTITGCNDATENMNAGGVENFSSFTMYGGTISKNSGKKGGGVCNYNSFTMYGGEITDNTATNNGGGVYNDGTFSVSGDVTITGNTKNDSPNNVYLAEERTYDKEKEEYKPAGTFKKITIVKDTDLSENARIGITLADGYDGSFLSSMDNVGFYGSNFISDNPNCYIVQDDDQMPIVKDLGFVVKEDNKKIENGDNITFEDTTPRTFDIVSTGGTMAGEIQVVLGDEESFSLEIEEIQSPSPSKSAIGNLLPSFTIAPKENLESGDYVTTVTVGTVKTSSPTEALPTALSVDEDDPTEDPAEPEFIDAISFTVSYSVPKEDTSSHSSSPRYKIIVEDGENGFAESSRSKSREDKTITLTLTPDEGYEVSSVLVETLDGREIETTSKGENTFTFTMPATNVWVTPSFEKLSTGSESSSSDDQNDTLVVPALVDVDPDLYYYEAVMWALQNGIASGTGTFTFSPEKYCTRAEFITFLWKMAGSPEPAVYANFSDVTTDAYYAKAVAWAVEKGIVSGLDDGRFAPDALCTRADIMCFLYRAAGSPDVMGDAPFLDVPTDAYYAKAVAWAEKNGVASGVSNGYFAPDTTCTRADAITFLYRSK